MDSKEPWLIQRRRVIQLTTVVLAGIFCVALLYILQRAVPAHADLDGIWQNESPGLAVIGTPQAALLTEHDSNQQLGIIAGSTFTFAIITDVVGLDPATGDLSESTLDQIFDTLRVTSQIYETLVNYQPGDVIPVPGLAKSWSVSSDGLTWTFELRPGVTFHDGTDLDAEAVRYNLERWWDPAHPYHNGGFDYFGYMFGGFKGDPDCLISSLDTIGTDTVQITLKEPYSPLSNTLAMPAFAIASPQAIESGPLSTHPVGSGPFKFVERVEGDHITLEANEDYWGDGPCLETLTFQVIADDAERFAALQSNSVQGIEIFSHSHVPTTTYVPTATLDTNLKVLWQPALNTGYLGINRSHSPLDIPEVRQAIAHAIDKKSIIDDHYNAEADIGQVATQLLPPVVWGYDQDLADYPYDPARAQFLLATAGYTNGFTTTLWVLPVERLYFPNAMDIVASVQADLEAVGITTTLVITDFETYLNRVVNGEADLFMLGWGGDNGHPDNFFHYLLCGDDRYQSFGPRDDFLCGLLQTARKEPDFGVQVVIYGLASERVHDTLPLVPIAHSRTPLILRRDVTGFIPAAVWFESFREVRFANSWVYLPVTFKNYGP